MTVNPPASTPHSSEALRAALAQAETSGDLAAQNTLLGELGRALLRQDDSLPALACFEKGLKVAQQLDDKPSGARHLANQGLALAQIGNFGLAMRAYRKALGFAADLADAPMQYDLLFHMAELERARQSPENALGHLDEALAIAERHRSLNRIQRVRAAMGQISLDQEEFEEAREHFEAALSLAREIGDVGEQSICLNALGGLARSRRDPSAAAGFFAQALALPAETQSSRLRLALLAQFADLRFGQGDLEISRQMFSEALALSRQLGDQASETRLLGSLGLIAADQGDPGQALALANEAVALARQLADPVLQGEQLLYQAMALADHDRVEDALTACDAAIVDFEQVEASSLLQKAWDLKERIGNPADE